MFELIEEKKEPGWRERLRQRIGHWMFDKARELLKPETAYLSMNRDFRIKMVPKTKKELVEALRAVRMPLDQVSEIQITPDLISYTCWSEWRKAEEER